MIVRRVIYLRPSKAETWGICAGYARLCTEVKAPIEDRGNDVREDGTATHWLSQEIWDGREPAVDSMSPNFRVLTEELFRGADEYIQYLMTWPGRAVLEQTMPTSAFFKGTSDGTPDAYLVLPTSTRGRLADLKMGFRPVEVWRNKQLVVYAWTIMSLFPHLTEMELTIIQPRAAHKDGTVRTWLVDRDELRILAAELQEAALNAHADNPLCVVNETCDNCAVGHACRSLQAAGGRGIETSYDATPHELSPNELAYELHKLQAAAQHIEHRITGLSAQAESLIRRGTRVPGYGLERRATRKRWRDEKVAEVEQVGRLFGVDVHAVKLLSPAKLRGTIPGIDIEAMFAEQPTGELALKATDPLEALKAFTSRK
jgi:hypothetical protein